MLPGPVLRQASRQPEAQVEDTEGCSTGAPRTVAVCGDMELVPGMVDSSVAGLVEGLESTRREVQRTGSVGNSTEA